MGSEWGVQTAEEDLQAAGLTPPPLGAQGGLAWPWEQPLHPLHLRGAWSWRRERPWP